jgi:hypothetical protein
MSVFSDLSLEVRQNLVDSQKTFVLEQMYTCCLRIGINPESFVPSEYVEVDYEDSNKNSNQEMLMIQISLYETLLLAENSLNAATPS